jgi:carbonic anhydrase
MKKITAILLASSMLLLANEGAPKAHWGYTGHNTPDKWGSLSEKYRECV